MARKRKQKRKNKNDGVGLIVIAVIILVIAQKFLELLITHIFLTITVIVFAIVLYVYYRIQKRKRQEKKRQELLQYNSTIQKKTILTMKSYLNSVLQIEKHHLTEKEKEQKKRLKESYYRLHEEMNSAYVYIIEESHNGYIKIGKANDPMQRIVHGLGAKSPYAIQVLHLIPTDVALEVEKWLHKAYEKERINGEWFQLSEEQKHHIQSGEYPLELLELIVKT